MANRVGDPAVQQQGGALSPQQLQLIDRLARRVVQLKLADVAILMIESVRPLNFTLSQLLHFFSPVVHSFGHYEDYETLAVLLENRGSVDALLLAIEREEVAHGE